MGGSFEDPCTLRGPSSCSQRQKIHRDRVQTSLQERIETLDRSFEELAERCDKDIDEASSKFREMNLKVVVTYRHGDSQRSDGNACETSGNADSKASRTAHERT